MRKCSWSRALFAESILFLIARPQRAYARNKNGGRAHTMRKKREKRRIAAGGGEVVQKEDATVRRPRRAFSSPPLREITDHGQREERRTERKEERKEEEKERGSNTDKKKPESSRSGGC